MSQNSSDQGEVHIQTAADVDEALLTAKTIQSKQVSSIIKDGIDNYIHSEKNVGDEQDILTEDYDMEQDLQTEGDVQSDIHDENVANEMPCAAKFEMDESNAMNMYNHKEKLKCTPAIQKLRKGLAEFDVRSPSDAMMSPVTAKLSQVRHTMKQSDAIRHGRGGNAVRKNLSPQRLIFEDDE